MWLSECYFHMKIFYTENNNLPFSRTMNSVQLFSFKPTVTIQYIRCHCVISDIFMILNDVFFSYLNITVISVFKYLEITIVSDPITKKGKKWIAFACSNKFQLQLELCRAFKDYDCFDLKNYLNCHCFTVLRWTESLKIDD